MPDADRSSTTHQSLSLSQWLYQALCGGEAQEGVDRLRLRLRGNHLHVLCEGAQLPSADRLVPRLIRALRSPEAEQFDLLTGRSEEPVYKIILYGRVAGESRPVWIEPVDLEPLRARPLPQTPAGAVVATNPASAPATMAETPETTTPSRPRTLATAPPQAPGLAADAPETLAQPVPEERIARHLSESLAPLGVSVRILVQKLPQAAAEAGQPADSADLKRLWVICSCSYSPDASLIAQPLARQLRELQLPGFKEAAIRLQVSGEATPDWVLQVDLTSPAAMLRDWAHWGDVQALERLLDQALRAHGVRVRATLAAGTLHIFCSLRSALGLPQEVPPQATTTAALDRVLEDLAPQGLGAATVYGVRSLELEAESLAPEALKEAPVWVQWLNLPAATQPERAPTAIALARQLQLPALTFLLQRLLNPKLDERLTTGGISVKLCIKDALLHIMTEALVCPPQVQVVSRIEKLLRSLDLPELQGARLYGRRAGQTTPLWSYALDFRPAPPVSVAATPGPAAVPAAPEPAAIAAAATTAPTPVDRELQAPLRRLLCWTRAFGPRRTAQELEGWSGSALSRWSEDRYLKVALLWAALGLALAVQVDWALGRTLRTQRTAEAPLATPTSTLGTLPPWQDQEPRLEDRRGDRFTTTLPEGRESEAAAAAILAAARSRNPSLNNPLLDEKLALYQERLQRGRLPDVLIVGSSRALRGVDPVVLRQAIANQGYRSLDVFNFGINGATAQTVDLVLRRILTPEQLPEVVIWADGARAFNSGRPDLTYEAIASSPGYQRLQAGTFPGQGRTDPDRRPPLTTQIARGFRAGYADFNQWFSDALGEFSATYPQREHLRAWLHARALEPLPGVEPLPSPRAEATAAREPIDLDGFLAIAARFNPETYYRAHARVSGAYDSDYDAFSLRGRQHEALREVLSYLKAQRVKVVFVNLPLTDEYLDPVRQEYEEQFVTHMEQVADRYGLVFRDLATRWPTEHDFFSDPSHLNRYGAYEVSQHLARDPAIPWELRAD